MKRQLVAGAFVLVAVLLAGMSTSMAIDLDFTLVNMTGVEIYQVNVSPSSEESWQEDILDMDTLPHGESVHVQFSGKGEECFWDLRVTDDEDNSIAWEGIDLCEVSVVTLFFEDEVPEAVLE